MSLLPNQNQTAVFLVLDVLCPPFLLCVCVVSAIIRTDPVDGGLREWGHGNGVPSDQRRVPSFERCGQVRQPLFWMRWDTASGTSLLLGGVVDAVFSMVLSSHTNAVPASRPVTHKYLVLASEEAHANSTNMGEGGS